MTAKRAFFKSCLLLLGVFLIGSLSSCNSGDTINKGNDDGKVQATEADGRDTATLAVNVAFRSFTASFGSPGAALTLDSDASALILQYLKNAISATSASNCTETTLPSPSGGSVTVNGSVGGSCAVAFSGDSTNGSVRANCTNYNDGSASADAQAVGLIGLNGSTTTTGTQSDFQLNNVTSKDLVLTLAAGHNCTAVVNLSAAVTIDNNTGSGSAAVTGCVKICGEPFDISGSETF